MLRLLCALRRVLDELEALLRSSELLPEDHGAAVQAVLQRAAVLLACGKTVGGGLAMVTALGSVLGSAGYASTGACINGILGGDYHEWVQLLDMLLLCCDSQEAYLDLALPVLGSTLRTLEAEATEGSHITDPKLRKRLKWVIDGAGAGPGGRVWWGDCFGRGCAEECGRCGRRILVLETIIGSVAPSGLRRLGCSSQCGNLNSTAAATGAGTLGARV